MKNRKNSKPLKSLAFPWKAELLGCLIPALLWLGATYARPLLIAPHCSTHPESCTVEQVPEIDRFSMKMENPDSDGFSYFTQNFSGAWAVLVPIAWQATQVVQGSLNPIAGSFVVGTDLLTLLQVASWNGFLTELSHLVTHRPRPFVYSDPTQRGIDPAHYTSFYSGHTSFVASMTTAVFLLLRKRRASRILLLGSFAAAEALTLATAAFRMFAGRHFLSDVICGAIAGSLTAWIVVSKNKDPISNKPLIDKI